MPSKSTTTPHDCPFKDIVIPKGGESREMNTRVGRLEGVVEALTKNIQEVSNNVNSISTQLTTTTSELKDAMVNSIEELRTGFSKQLDTVTDRLTTNTKPQWQTIGAFVSLAIVLLGMSGAVVALIMNGQAENIRSVQANTTAISERLFNGQYEKGKADATTAAFADHFKNLDITLQREMNLIASVVDTKVNGLDTKLQIEFNLTRKNLETYIDANVEDNRNMRAWRLKHSEEDAALTSEIRAKQQMIEKHIDELDKRQWEYRVDKLRAYETSALDKK
jgi:DNA-binding FrmR family transcriptional regulator